ncbi:MAG TPA: transglutaminase-like domain-containing protein, partial [Candidatus Hydrogenedentes bacterium]|nr:transglutaminase-like domain-containing protein [Candidatus Hydrogenedentota bacterium]
PTRFIQSDDPKLIAKAREIVGDETNSMKIVEKLSSWVNDNVQTTFSARLTNALEVLNSLEGDCTEHSVLFIALARAAGLPAREVAGLIYMDGDRPGFYFHQWAKVWVGKWVDVDPTWDQSLADVTHIKLGEGDLFQQAQLIPIIGRIQVEVVDDNAAN